MFFELFWGTYTAELSLFEAFSDRRFPEMLSKVTIPLRTSLEKSKKHQAILLFR